MSKKKSIVPHKPRNPNIYRFIDFFVRTGEKIRGEKPIIIRGKDGKLVSYALRRIPVGKLETLAVWFLARKKKLQPLVGTMVSHKVLEELEREINKSSFWKEIDALMDMYYPREATPSAGLRMWQPFTHADITHMKEDVAKIMRTNRVL